MLPVQALIPLIFCAAPLSSGQENLPTLPEAIQLFQLESMNNQRETIERQERVIVEQRARIVELEGEIIAKDLLIEKCEAEKTQLRVGCESTIQYMGNVMLQHNKVMLEGQKLLGSQAQGSMLRFEEQKTKRGAPSLTSVAASSTLSLLLSIAPTTNQTNHSHPPSNKDCLAPDWFECDNKRCIVAACKCDKQNDCMDCTACCLFSRGEDEDRKTIYKSY